MIYQNSLGIIRTCVRCEQGVFASRLPLGDASEKLQEVEARGCRVRAFILRFPANGGSYLPLPTEALLDEEVDTNMTTGQEICVHAGIEANLVHSL